jgi:hypothetical protein
MRAFDRQLDEGVFLHLHRHACGAHGAAKLQRLAGGQARLLNDHDRSGFLNAERPSTFVSLLLRFTLLMLSSLV